MSTSTQGMQVILVEDNAADPELTMDALRRSGMVNTVQWVRDGAEALDVLFEHGADSIAFPFCDSDTLVIATATGDGTVAVAVVVYRECARWPRWNGSAARRWVRSSPPTRSNRSCGVGRRRVALIAAVKTFADRDPPDWPWQQK